jgi:molybdopterin molybdotransferase
MISIEEAKRIIAENLPARLTERINLIDALGRVLADNITAPEPSPRYSNSAMDGFAARWDDVQSANESNPVSLPVVGESSAGIPYQKELVDGQAIRISTGAMIPDGADVVVPQEDTQSDNRAVKVLRVTKKHQNIRFEGEEFSSGDVVLKDGVVIQSPQIGLLSSLGIQEITAFRKPKVAIVVTGTEVKPFDSEIRPWQIRDSNSVMLRAAIEESGGELVFNEIVGDDLSKTQLVLNEAIEKAEIVVFSGGVSVGPHDLVKTAVEDAGFQTLFWRVNQKPGKPLFTAKKDNILLFGLPGNPVSAYMCYLVYIHPVIKHFLNIRVDQKVIRGRLKERIENKFNRDHMLRVRIEKSAEEIPRITPVKKQGSHMLTSLTDADGFILIEAKKTIAVDSILPVTLF